MREKKNASYCSCHSPQCWAIPSTFQSSVLLQLRSFRHLYIHRKCKEATCLCTWPIPHGHPQNQPFPMLVTSFSPGFNAKVDPVCVIHPPSFGRHIRSPLMQKACNAATICNLKIQNEPDTDFYYRHSLWSRYKVLQSQQIPKALIAHTVYYCFLQVFDPVLVCLFSWEWVDKLFITTLMREFHIYWKYNYVKFKCPLFAASIHSTMGLEIGKARSIYAKGSCPQKRGEKKKRKQKEKSDFAFNPSVLDPITIMLVNKAEGLYLLTIGIIYSAELRR